MPWAQDIDGRKPLTMGRPFLESLSGLRRELAANDTFDE
jgi:hypothetical protein